MGLIGAQTGIWSSLQSFTATKPVWGTCAGLILLANSAVGTSAVINQGAALIGGLDCLVCRNYFGSQISSFELGIEMPDCIGGDDFKGVFIRAPAILTPPKECDILATVKATPSRQANAVLEVLEEKMKKGEKVTDLQVIHEADDDGVISNRPEKKQKTAEPEDTSSFKLPGASGKGGAREVVVALKKGNILATAFHPELTEDVRWHQYFVDEFVNKM
ncbi:hypothetical protein TL16_g02457 [Triparma laevis f. inornata]|uniref:Glutaminase n=2 Tax=Triparma laevis TaxID=1534972 RepID=A0A9W7F0V2_9STRA|nr:hypothetical protein TL16_g02457 [Triparma laevis f. inornata]GMH98943.1 hypothetical protein TrLO_g14228 [Triparma laevis f. longispina]